MDGFPQAKMKAVKVNDFEASFIVSVNIIPPSTVLEVL